jgi:hypothetical protein
MTDAERSPAAAESPAPAGHVPRLSIAHLLLWVLCAVCYLAVLQISFETVSAAAVGARMMAISMAVIVGAILAGGIVLVAGRVRSGPPLLRFPGHWLLFVSAFFAAANLLLFVAIKLLELMGFEFREVWPVYGLLSVAEAAGYVYAFYHNRPVVWRVTFGGLAVLYVLQSLTYVALWFGPPVISWMHPWITIFPNLGYALLCVWLIVLVVVDVAAGRRQDWLHWTGVVSYVSYRGVHLVSMVAVGAFR